MKRMTFGFLNSPPKKKTERVKLRSSKNRVKLAKPTNRVKLRSSKKRSKPKKLQPRPMNYKGMNVGHLQPPEGADNWPQFFAKYAHPICETSNVRSFVRYGKCYLSTTSGLVVALLPEEIEQEHKRACEDVRSFERFHRNRPNVTDAEWRRFLRL